MRLLSYLLHLIIYIPTQINAGFVICHLSIYHESTTLVNNYVIPKINGLTLSYPSASKDLIRKYSLSGIKT